MAKSISIKDLVYETQINYGEMSNFASEFVYPKIKPINKIGSVEKWSKHNGQNYSKFGFVMRTRRHTRPYIWVYYIPSSSVVIIAGKI